MITNHLSTKSARCHLELEVLSSDDIDVDSDTGGIPILEELGLSQYENYCSFTFH